MRKEKHYKYDKIVSISVRDFKKNPNYKYIEYETNFLGKKKFVGKLENTWSFEYKDINTLDKTLSFINNVVYYKPQVVIDFVNEDQYVKRFDTYEEAIKYRNKIKNNTHKEGYFEVNYDD